MNAIDRLKAARAAVDEGKYEEALSEYVWFHENALAEDTALHGVRLSFALAFWRDLGVLYPPALAKLQETADAKRMLLEQGAEDWSLFNDVVAIHRELKNERATYELFLSIHHRNPEFATRCARIATPAMIQFEDFALARSFVSEPQTSVRRLAGQFNEDIEYAFESRSHKRRKRMIEAHLHNYLEAVLMLATVFFRTGETRVTDELIGIASQAVDNPKLKRMIGKKLMRSREALRQTSPT